MSSDSNSTGGAEARALEEVHDVSGVASDPVLRPRSKPRRRAREPVQGVQECPQRAFASIGGRARVACCPGPFVREDRSGNLHIGFAQAMGHASSKGIHIVRHMLPWWRDDHCWDDDGVPVGEDCEYVSKVLNG